MKSGATIDNGQLYLRDLSQEEWMNLARLHSALDRVTSQRHDSQTRLEKPYRKRHEAKAFSK